MIVLPAFGRMNCTETTMSLMETANALRDKGIRYYFATQTYPEIDELRNMLLTLWYDRVLDATHLLTIDADMGFPGKLVTDMFDFDVPLAGCLYPKKTYPISYVGKAKAGPPRVVNGFMDIEGAGGGVLLIRRDCVDVMLAQGAATSDERLVTHAAGPLLAEWGVKRLIRAFDKIETETGRVSEDLSFCKRFIACGGEVWASIDHRITHVGPHGYSGRYADLLEQPAAVPAGPVTIEAYRV
jgi:hypothetical protein